MKKYKLVVTIPESYGDMLRDVIGKAGGGKVGDYSHCSFTVKGIGRFMPLEGANPSIGTVGKAEGVIEERIEINCDDSSLPLILRAIKDNHPYEEPAIDLYPLIEL